MYNVVLGLEVLGNPAGFIKGLKEGAVGLFYQPFEVLLDQSHACVYHHTKSQKVYVLIFAISIN